MEDPRKNILKELLFKDNRDVFNIHEGAVPYLSFKSLDAEGVINAFSTKLVGVSEGYYASMNLSFTRGDRKEAVLENYRRFSSAIGVDIKRMTASKQTHSTNIRKVTKADYGKGIFIERDYDNIDGLITDIKGVTLVTFYADCIPLYFYSPKRKCIGLSHSGWRGTVNRMGKATVESLEKEYGADPKELICCIAPGICGDCFATDHDLAIRFIRAFPDSDTKRLVKYISEENTADDILNKDISLLKKKGVSSQDDVTEGRKYYIDLWYANYLVLREAGVRSENISVTNLCTRCNHKFLYSHRICGDRRGNAAAMLCMKEE